MSALRDTRVSRVTRSRDFYLEAGREYVRRYGADEMTASSFNPASAKRNGRPDLVDRYYAGREDGSTWPSLNAIKKNFDGSFHAYRRALGLPKNKVGGTKRRRPGEAEPILTIRERRIISASAGTGWLKRQMEKAERRAERLAERLDEEKAKHQPVAEPTAKEIELRQRLADEKHRRKEVQRELHNAVRREARARANATKVRYRRANTCALKEVDRLTQRLAETEARLRKSRSKSTANGATKVVTKTIKVQDTQLLRQIEKLEDQVTEMRAALKASEAARAEAVERLADIRQDALAEAVASQKVRSAEKRAGELEVQLAKQAEILTGERRLLDIEKVESMRTDGPAGRAVFTAMVKRVARADGSGATRDALWDVIGSARNWIDRL